MTDLAGLVTPGHTALVLQEVQVSVLGSGVGVPGLSEAVDSIGLIENLRLLAAAARQAQVPVIHCTFSSLPGAFGRNRNARLFQMFAGAKPSPDEHTASEPGASPLPAVHSQGDIVLPRYQGLGPLAGELDFVLRNGGIRSVVATGVSLNVGVMQLVFGLVDRGYDVVVPADAVVGLPVDYGHQVIRNTIGLLATLSSAAEVAEVWNTPAD